jgi:hypothetical protein
MGVPFIDAWNTVSVLSFPLMLMVAELWIRATRIRDSVAPGFVPPRVQPQA